jgi:hypothetical protein
MKISMLYGTSVPWCDNVGVAEGGCRRKQEDANVLDDQKEEELSASR